MFILDNLPDPYQGLIGHRGAAGLAPENTLASFRKAKDMGLNWVEFDIQHCLSGEWIAFHDTTLERTTHARGIVEQTTYEVIQSLDAGSWFGPQFKNERVPLLKEVLDCLVDLKLHPNIEIKTGDPRKPHHSKKHQAEHFFQQLGSYWPKRLPPPLVSSFDLEFLILLRALNHHLPLGFIVENLSQQNLQSVLENSLNTLHCDHKNLVDKKIELEQAFAYHIPLLVYTVNEPNRIKTLLQWGISAVFSDLTHLS